MSLQAATWILQSKICDAFRATCSTAFCEATRCGKATFVRAGGEHQSLSLVQHATAPASMLGKAREPAID